MTKNFIELINENEIIIPLIQRDYAQGREKEKKRANDFLDAILDGTKNSLNLDFVYGKVEDKKFTPLDGQQRLTTLFLIHWFISLESKYIEELNKFTYEVRSSTKDFIKHLTDKENWIKFKKVDIKQQIENSNWFFLSWRNDPTVVAILNMLNLVEIKFRDVNINDLNNITFEFLNLDDFKLTDELYVKMNARGKPLTEFENFKSKFEKYLIFENKEYEHKIKAKLDNDWLDIFWDIAQKEVEDNKKLDLAGAPKIADEKYFNFFQNLTTFYSDEFNEVDVLKFDYKNTILDIVKILDCLKNYKVYQDIILELRDYATFKINIFQDFINIDKSKPEYEKRLRFYAMMKFFIKIGDINLEENKNIFKQWMRVSLNIINNTNYNTIKEFNRDKKILDDLINILDNEFYKTLSTSTISGIEQFKEESLKAELILNNKAYENEFVIVERNWYLDGQIKFLIKFAYDRNSFDINKFKEYRNQFITLWNFSKAGRDNHILIYQALLTKGNYLPQVAKSDNFTFCSFETNVRAKSDNWQKVFNDPIKSEYLRTLLDDKRALEDIILEWLKNKSYCNLETSQEKYIYTLVLNQENIKYCKNLQLRYYQDGKEIYLLKTTQMNGMHVELYTWNLFIHQFKLVKKTLRKVQWRLESNFASTPFKTTYYNPSKSWALPSIVLDGWEKYEINIIYDFKNESFQIEFFDNNNKKLQSIDKTIKSILLRNSFILDENEYEDSNLFIYKNTNINLCNQDELVTFLQNLLEEFNK